MPTRSTQDPDVIRALRDFRLSLIARENQQLERLAQHWIGIEYSLNDEMQLLAFQIMQAKQDGAIITEQLLRRYGRYQQLQTQMKAQILSFARDVAVPDIETEQQEYGEAAIDIANDVIKSQFRFPPNFNRLPAEHVNTYVGYLGNNAPLYSLLKEAYPDALDGVVKAFLEGASKGLSPNQIAMNASKGLGLGLERITLIARTEQLRVSRAVSADQYRSSGLPGAMKRVATKDGRACLACIMSDGEIIPLDQELDDHPRGRCTAIFQIKGTKEIQWEKGPDWFMKQGEELQRDMMGNKTYEAWKQGKFDLSLMRQNAYSDVWGQSPRVPSLKELLSGDLEQIIQPRAITKKKQIAAPQTIEKSNALGIPISNSLNNQITNKEIKRQMEIAMAAVNKVHGDGDLPTIPIRQTSTRKNHGAFHFTLAGKPDRITISSRGDHHGMTLIHEIGHFLDLAATNPPWSSANKNGVKENGLIVAVTKFTDWHSDIWKRFASANNKLAEQYPGGYQISKKWTNYLLSNEELFARAYAQFIIIESGDPELLAQLRKAQSGDFPTQWSDDDFKPVYNIFQKTFRERGWMK